MQRKRNPKVCFLGTVYNGAVYLAETLESIRKQTLKDIEVIYIDDGSTDSTVDILTYYASIDPRFSFHSLPKNEGISAAWNYGLTFVTTPVICISSADDIYIPERAELSYKALKSGKKDVFYGAFFRAHENMSLQMGYLQDGSPAWICETVPYKKGCLDKKQTIGHGFMAVTTEIAKAVPYRKGLKVGVDYPFLKDLEAYGARWCWTNDVLGTYRLQKKSVSFTRYEEVDRSSQEAKK